MRTGVKGEGGCPSLGASPSSQTRAGRLLIFVGIHYGGVQWEGFAVDGGSIT